jgi:acyl-CoA thioester hydrolase
MSLWSMSTRVYWEDTDAGGVVYYARYLQFLERARSDYLRRLGVEQSSLQREHNLVFAVRRVVVDYLAPARLDDELVVCVDRVAATAVRLKMPQRILRATDQRLLLTAELDIVALSADTFAPKRMPPALFKLFNS